MPPEMNVQLLRTTAILLGYTSSVIGDSPKSFQLIKCKPDSPPRWLSHR